MFNEILVLGLQFREQNLLYATPKLITEATIEDSASADTIAQFVPFKHP
jgi:hypothetical protein